MNKTRSEKPARDYENIMRMPEINCITSSLSTGDSACDLWLRGARNKHCVVDTM